MFSSVGERSLIPYNEGNNEHNNEGQLIKHEAMINLVMIALCQMKEQTEQLNKRVSELEAENASLTGNCRAMQRSISASTMKDVESFILSQRSCPLEIKVSLLFPEVLSTIAFAIAAPSTGGVSLLGAATTGAIGVVVAKLLNDDDKQRQKNMLDEALAILQKKPLASTQEIISSIRFCDSNDFTTEQRIEAHKRYKKMEKKLADGSRYIDIDCSYARTVVLSDEDWGTW